MAIYRADAKTSLSSGIYARARERRTQNFELEDWSDEPVGRPSTKGRLELGLKSLIRLQT